MKELFNAISSFLYPFDVRNFLRRCKAREGVPVLGVFKHLFESLIGFDRSNRAGEVYLPYSPRGPRPALDGIILRTGL